MANKKYEQYVTTDFPPVESEEPMYKAVLIMDTEGVKTFKAKNLSLAASFITEPGVMVSEPHAHDFDQFLVFIGADQHSKSLGGEAEIYLGEEREKYVINTPTIVHIPRGMIHCPLTHKKIDKPYIFLDIFLSPKYKRSSSK